MRYFKCKARMEQKIKPETEKGESVMEQLAEKSVTYIEKNSSGCLACVTSVYKKECTFIFAGNGDDAQIEQEITAFWDFIGIEGGILEKTETCAANIYRVLRMARVDLPDNYDELFDVEYSRSIDADEHIAAAPEDLTLAAYAEANHFPELRAEAERIAAAKDTAAFYGHPVHYILEENNSEKAKQTVDHLVQTLYRANRLQSARIIIIDEQSFGMRGMNEALRKLYRNFQGGTIVASLAASGSDGEYADASEDLIAKICRLAVQHQHEVLTVFRIPQNNTEAKNAISTYLNNELTMLTFAEQPSDYEGAAAYMKMICAQKGVADPAPFIEKINPDLHSFYTAELDLIFRDYYGTHLKETHYPAYLTCGNTAVKEAKLEGKAADELHDMIGLDKVKQVIEESVSYYKIQKLYHERGIKLNTPARSMVFTGNPGTAKTTVARLTAKIFKDNGLLESGRIVEVGRADLVGKYVGWTAPTVKAAFQRAKGSILFIDEAYSLVDDRDGMFGDEAINTIVQEMENRREDTIVIFAGYPDKMEQFLQKNPGLRSRIAFHVDFPDYTPEELLDILRLMAKEHSMKLTPDAEDAALAIFRNAVKIHDFGNGRFVRNVLEQAQMRMSRRLSAENTATLTTEQLTTLCAEDFAAPEMCAAVPERRVIGF